MKNIIKSGVLFLVFTLLLIGCSPAERPIDPTPDQTPSTDRVEENQNVPGNDYMRTDDTDNGNDEDLTARAEKISQEISKLNEVDGATVVISEKTALVGVNLPSDVDGELTTETKKKVEDVVKRTDREITMVAVSADPDIVGEMEDMWDDMENGRPVSGFADQIQDLLRRIVPNA